MVTGAAWKVVRWQNHCGSIPRLSAKLSICHESYLFRWVWSGRIGYTYRDPVDLSAELAKAKVIINRNFRVLVIINRETGETQDKS